MSPPQTLDVPMPQHCIEAEQSVLGGLLLDNGAWDRIADTIAVEDFYRDDHRRIFQHIAKIIEQGKPADVVTVAESIEVSEDNDKTGGLTYLGKLAQNTPTVQNIRRYAEIVREKAEKRACAAAVADMERAADTPGSSIGDVISYFEARTDQLKSRCGPRSHTWPKPLDLDRLAECEPTPPKFIVPDWLPCGYATLFSGHGGVGKSGIALHLAVCIALGIPFFGIEVERRRVLYLSAEDRENILHWRLSRICAHLGADLASLRGWLDVLDLVGHDSILWERELSNGYTITPAYGALTKRMRDRQVLFVDGISDTFGGNENSRVEVKRFVNTLLALVPPDEGALLLVGHVAKPAASGLPTSEGYSGSTGWHNAARARWYLFPEVRPGDEGESASRTGDLILELQKSNLGRSDARMRFGWDDEAHLFFGREVVGATAADRAARETAERKAVLAAFAGCPEPVPAATTGRRTAYNVLEHRPEFPDSLRDGAAGRRRFWRHVEALRQRKDLLPEEYRTPARKWVVILRCANAPMVRE